MCGEKRCTSDSRSTELNSIDWIREAVWSLILFPTYRRKAIWSEACKHKKLERVCSNTGILGFNLHSICVDAIKCFADTGRPRKCMTLNDTFVTKKGESHCEKVFKVLEERNPSTFLPLWTTCLWQRVFWQYSKVAHWHSTLSWIAIRYTTWSPAIACWVT